MPEQSYTPTSLSDPIRYYRAQPAGPGYYFWDETWAEIHGPFATLEECREALKRYVNEVLGR